jgi:hypothetical protein
MLSLAEPLNIITNVTQVAGKRIPIANTKINFVEHLTSQLLTVKQ